MIFFTIGAFLAGVPVQPVIFRYPKVLLASLARSYSLFYLFMCD